MNSVGYLTPDPAPILIRQDSFFSARRITAFALAILTSIVSFVTLPVNSALFASLGALALATVWTCSSSSLCRTITDWVPVLLQREPRPIYVTLPEPDPATPPPRHIQVASTVVQGVPVARQGHRVQVGGGHQIAFQEQDEYKQPWAVYPVGNGASPAEPRLANPSARQHPKRVGVGERKEE